MGISVLLKGISENHEHFGNSMYRGTTHLHDILWTLIYSRLTVLFDLSYYNVALKLLEMHTVKEIELQKIFVIAWLWKYEVQIASHSIG